MILENTLNAIWGKDPSQPYGEFCYNQGMQDMAEQIKESIHEIYKCGFYCMGEYCSKEGNNCEDCMYEAVMKAVTRLKCKKGQE